MSGKVKKEIISKNSSKKKFGSDLVHKVLLWSNRICCICRTQCGINIEIAHIGDRTDNSIENAAPLCFNCHALYGHYNNTHPKGKKISKEELKIMRDQLYREQTRHLVPPIEVKLISKNLPNVGVKVANLGEHLPVELKIKINTYIDENDKGSPKGHHYQGEHWWQLNPRFEVIGNFDLPISIDDIELIMKEKKMLKIEVKLTIKDVYEFEHNEYHEFGWYYDPEMNKPDGMWIYEPCKDRKKFLID